MKERIKVPNPKIRKKTAKPGTVITPKPKRKPKYPEKHEEN